MAGRSRRAGGGAPSRRSEGVSKDTRTEPAVRPAPAPEITSAHPPALAQDGADLPLVVYVADMARLLRISEKAVRTRALRGQLPRPFRSGKTLAWTRDVVISWVRDCARPAGPRMKIKTRPYHNDPTRFHVDIRFMNPCNDNEEIRRRLVAPSGLDEQHARAWGERQVPAILRELVAATGGTTDEAAKAIKETTSQRAPQLTFAAFYEQRFLPEYVQLQKPATQTNYETIYRNHLGPLLGDVPLAAIDDDRISRLRAELLRRVGKSTANLILAKLTKILRLARRLHKIAAFPEIDKLPQGKSAAKPVYADDEVARLVAAARAYSAEAELVVLLALDACLRVSEICALEWTDVDLTLGTIKVQHNVYRGQKQTPKGTIGTIALSSALRTALAEHRKRQPIGPLVVYRRSQYTNGEWAPHTPHSARRLLNLAQRHAGLPESGPHLLRHSGLTRLANLGASVYVVQAVARHARLQTTQAYLHTQQAKLTHEAAALLDGAAANAAAGKPLATPARPRRK